MPAYNFKKEFASAVRASVDGTFACEHPDIAPKNQTIRKRRKRRTRIGETLYLYTGMRTSACSKLGESICSNLQSLKITEKDIFQEGSALSDKQSLKLAQDDGFENVSALRSFFRNTYGLPFDGVLVMW